MTSFERLLSPLGLASFSQCKPRRSSDAGFPAGASFFLFFRTLGCASMRLMTDEVWRRGGWKAPKTEYSSLCNRFNLLCRNRLQYFASLLESCISLLPLSLTPPLLPSRLSPSLQYGTLHFIVSLGSEEAATTCLCLISQCPPPRRRHMIVHHG